MDDYAWGWDLASGGYRLIYDAGQMPGVAHQLPPWQGCWLFARTACELVVPPPLESGTRKAESGNDWSLRLQAAAEGETAQVRVGVGASRALQAGVPPAPPEGEAGVQVVSVREGRTLAVDVRRGGGRQVWEVVVQEAAGEVVVTWPDLRAVPGEVSLTLEDQVTGERRSLRTTSHYTYTPARGETARRFRLIAEAGRERSLQVTGLRAAPTRGGGLEIRFALSRAARTTVRVCALSGRRVSVLEQRRERERADHALRWDGRDAGGRRLPAGMYLVEVQAEDDEGRQVKAVAATTVR